MRVSERPSFVAATNRVCSICRRVRQMHAHHLLPCATCAVYDTLQLRVYADDKPTPKCEHFKCPAEGCVNPNHGETVYSQYFKRQALAQEWAASNERTKLVLGRHLEVWSMWVYT